MRRAERRLAAAVARIGVSEAELYPRISLTGSFGYESDSGGDLLKSASRYWSIGPSLRWPLFSSGRIRARIAQANARADQAAILYEQTVLQALGEVEDALVAEGRGGEQLVQLDAAVSAAERAVEIAAERRRAGIDDQRAVLIQRRALLQAEDKREQSRLARTLATVALAKALGGGWE